MYFFLYEKKRNSERNPTILYYSLVALGRKRETAGEVKMEVCSYCVFFFVCVLVLNTCISGFKITTVCSWSTEAQVCATKGQKSRKGSEVSPDVY